METRKITGNSLFQKIASIFTDQEDLQKLEKASVILSFKKGEIILKQGHPATHVAFLQSGIVKFNIMSDNSEKNVILTLVSAPKILGGANLFYKDNNLFSIVAVEDCDVVLVDTVILLEMLKKNGSFAVAMFQMASDMFKKAILNFISVANKQKEGRIADVVLYLSSEIYNSSSFCMSLTRKELAEFACCSVENVIMTLSRWQNEGIVVISGKRIEIIDKSKLVQISKVG